LALIVVTNVSGQTVIWETN